MKSLRMSGNISNIQFDCKKQEYKKHALEYYNMYAQRAKEIGASFDRERKQYTDAQTKSWFRCLLADELVNLDYDVRLCTDLRGVPAQFDFGDGMNDSVETTFNFDWSDDDKCCMILLLQHKHFEPYDKEILRAIGTQLPFDQTFLIAHAMILVGFHMSIQLERALVGFKAVGDYLIRTLHEPTYRQALLEDPFKQMRGKNKNVLML